MIWRRPVIVFLHIPKTAGQTLHHEIGNIFGEPQISPIRLYSQAAPQAQMPRGYRFYSGHLDWDGLDHLPAHRFAFTVLRDPLERIASFYFFLQANAGKLTAEELDLPQNHGLKMVKSLSAGDYFTAGNLAWQRFIRDHYDNFYCSYLATGRVLGRRRIDGMTAGEVIMAARNGAGRLDRIYTTERLTALEADMKQRCRAQLTLTGKYHNSGVGGGGVLRWPQLAERLDSDAQRRRVEDFAAMDYELMRQLPLA